MCSDDITLSLRDERILATKNRTIALTFIADLIVIRIGLAWIADVQAVVTKIANIVSIHIVLVRVIGGAIGFGYIFLYFWLLDYFGESWWYWPILIIGFVGPNLLIFAPAILKG